VLTDDTVIRATVWNDYVEEREYYRIGDPYPEGLHGAAHEKLQLCQQLAVQPGRHVAGPQVERLDDAVGGHAQASAGIPSTFPPPDAQPRGTGWNWRDAEAQSKLSTGRLCTSPAIIGSRWGWDGTREVTAVL
jgi:hypothetical protein